MQAHAMEDWGKNAMHPLPSLQAHKKKEGYCKYRNAGHSPPAIKRAMEPLQYCVRTMYQDR